jgi:hypothetical protein
MRLFAVLTDDYDQRSDIIVREETGSDKHWIVYERNVHYTHVDDVVKSLNLKEKMDDGET